MKFRKVLKLALVSSFLWIPSVALSVSWSGKSVGHLQSTGADADCFYFTLDGVAEADPVKPGNPWFAIPRTQYGAKDGYAMLLAAKLSGQIVNISTNSTLSCGFPTASAVWVP